MTDEIRQHLNIIGALGLGLCGIEIFGLIMSCVLYIKLKRIYEDDWHSSVNSSRTRNSHQTSNGHCAAIYNGHTLTNAEDNGDDDDGVFPIDISLWWGDNGTKPEPGTSEMKPNNKLLKNGIVTTTYD